jgi:hypothetical protein
MSADAYEFETGAGCMNFRFFSEGPRGIIEKGIVFSKMDLYSSTLFNLGFGDINKKGVIDDLAISNNNDAEKILVTVAKTAIVFTDRNPDAVIYIKGSTPSRTRRYQMGINKFLIEIEAMFDVYGRNADGRFEPFKPGKNYRSFLGVRKKMYI